MFDFKRLREYQYMKSCHFYYIQRKTDGATKKITIVEPLFFLAFVTHCLPLRLFQRNTLIRLYGKCSFLSLIPPSFVKTGDFGKI